MKVQSHHNLSHVTSQVFYMDSLKSGVPIFSQLNYSSNEALERKTSKATSVII